MSLHDFTHTDASPLDDKRIILGGTSVVIYPPVEVDRFEVCKRSEGYYLIVSRLVSYKGIDRAVRAFSECRKRLIVVGDGPDRARLQALAGSTVQFKGHVSDAEVKRYLENSYAFVFPGLEGFGITAVEAQAAGKPVLAFGAGGALEVDGVTGLFFYGAEILAIKQAWSASSRFIGIGTRSEQMLSSLRPVDS